jgi:hypothetical protein
MDIVASCGECVGTVDHLEGADRIKVTRHNPAVHKDGRSPCGRPALA